MQHPLATSLLVALGLAAGACGATRRPQETPEPFVAGAPTLPGPGTAVPTPIPPPTFPRTPVWDEDAFSLGRTATFGSFPADLVRFGSTLFTVDADAIEGAGALIVPIDVSGTVPTASSRYRPTRLLAGSLVDSAGAAGDAAAPIGFGFFVNDLEIASDTVGFALVSAGGSDSVPTLSNLVVFDPTAGTVLQVFDLAQEVPTLGLPDSEGAAPAGPTFRQSQAEGLCFVPLDGHRGRLFVAMANIVIGGPSYGATKLPGTVQVYDVDLVSSAPVAYDPVPPYATRTLYTTGYNPVAVTRVAAAGGAERVLVTVAGTSHYGAGGALVPAGPSCVETFDARSLAPLGRFDLGWCALAGARPALGTDAAGHRVAFFASSVLGTVYLLWLDGLFDAVVAADRVAVVRGEANPIPIDPSSSGQPNGNVAGLALSSDGRTLVASGFGDYFAPAGPQPGKVYAYALPSDLVADPAFALTFVPGTATALTTAGRTLGPLVVGASHPDGPEVFVLVAGPLSTSTYLGTGPASLGTLSTFGRIR
ncbi:MAG: hypothetical protein IT460_08385 [Planctomycetes bacterium]|nr:hypothetical protein [Planctomycetota bacterium]